MRLNAAGLADIGQIAATPVDLLALLLGSQAPLAAAVRPTALTNARCFPPREPQKSFSQQETFDEDVTDEEYVEAVLRRMADRLFAAVRQEGRSVRTLAVKVRYNDRDENQRAESLREPTDLETDIYGRLRGLLREAWQRRVSLRMVSLKLSNVYDGVFRRELPLEGSGQNHAARERLAAALDELRRNKGWSVVLRGHDFRLRDAPEDVAGEQAKRIPSNWKSEIRRPSLSRPACAGGYAPLRVRSFYTFLDSTLSPGAVVDLARRHGLSAIALTDLGNLHGAVEFAQAAERAGVKPIFGTELQVGGRPRMGAGQNSSEVGMPRCGVRTAQRAVPTRGNEEFCPAHPLLLYVESARGYHNLNRLLTRQAEARHGGEEGAVAAMQRLPIPMERLDGLTEGLIAVSPDLRLAELFPGRFYQMAAKQAGQGPLSRGRLSGDSLRQPGRPHEIRHRAIHPHADAARGRNTRTNAWTGGFISARRRKWRAACQDHPEWLAHSLEIADRCQFEMPFGKPQFPAFAPPDGSTPRAFLHRLVLGRTAPALRRTRRPPCARRWNRN